MKTIVRLFVANMLFVNCISAGQIIYPWRACPVIVQAGQTVDVLYDNTTFMPIDSFILQGPFSRILLHVNSVRTGRFGYDSFTGASVNHQIVVTIPAGTPEELYDLILKSAGEISISRKSVKVVTACRQPHCFIHISDPHISRQWVKNAQGGYAKELELLDRFVEVANIIHPDFIIVTGDLIHDRTRINADSTGWGGRLVGKAEQRPLVEEKYKNYLEGAHGFSGIYGLNAPVFSVAGNHDFYGLAENDYPGKAMQWNRLMGKRVYGFSYRDTRVVVVDDFLGDPIKDIPDSAPMSGLQGRALDSFLNVAGHGKLRIMAQHRHNRVDTAFINRHRINILLNGHDHTPCEEAIGTTPTLSTRPGTVCKSGEIRNWEKTLGCFRIFRVDGDMFYHSPALRFCKNPTLPYHRLQPNLSLVFKKNNDGTSTSNEAVLTNDFDVDLPDCYVRFIMPRGQYAVTEGTVYQTLENSRYTVLDIRTDIQARSRKTVTIQEQKNAVSVKFSHKK